MRTGGWGAFLPLLGTIFACSPQWVSAARKEETASSFLKCVPAALQGTSLSFALSPTSPPPPRLLQAHVHEKMMDAKFVLCKWEQRLWPAKVTTPSSVIARIRSDWGLTSKNSINGGRGGVDAG